MAEAPAKTHLEEIAEVWIHHFLEAEGNILVSLMLKQEVSDGHHEVTCHIGVKNASPEVSTVQRRMSRSLPASRRRGISPTRTVSRSPARCSKRRRSRSHGRSSGRSSVRSHIASSTL